MEITLDLKTKLDIVSREADQVKLNYLKYTLNIPLRYLIFELKYITDEDFSSIVINKKFLNKKLANKSNSILLYLFSETENYDKSKRCSSVVTGAGPDIDTDFSPSGKDVIIKELQKKYGDLCVIRPTTYTPYSVKSSTVDFTKALGGTFEEGRALADSLPDSYRGKATTWADLKDDPVYADILDKHKEVFSCVSVMDKQPMNQSQHASAVIIGSHSLDSHIPLRKVKGEKDDQGNWYYLSQWEAGALEKSCNLIKFDILVIDNLDLLKNTAAAVGKTIDWIQEEVPLDDPKAFTLINQGFVSGIFQMEESHVFQVISEVQPTTVADLAAISALIRPGPKDNGLTDDWVQYKKTGLLQNKIHPLLDSVLAETGGVLVYQEQCMAALSVLAGFSEETSDNVRRAMGKKDPVEMESWKDRFIQGCIQTSKITEAEASYVWEYIDKFSGYGFNKPHAYAYALIAYSCAYLKAYCTVEFMIQLMSLRSNKPDKLKSYIDECRTMGIEMLPPSVLTPHVGFAKVGTDKIRFGIDILKGIGKSVANYLIAGNVHKANSLRYWLSNINRSKVNSGSLAILAKVGALDCFGHKREELVESLPLLLDYFNQYDSYIENQANIKLKNKELEQWSIEVTNWEHLYKTKVITRLATPVIDENGTKQIYTEPKPKKPIIPKPKDEPSFPELPVYEKRSITKQMVDWEGEYCGLYISAHPIDFIKIPPTIELDYINNLLPQVSQSGRCLVVITTIEDIQIKRGKMKGRSLYACTVEDKTGVAELTLFPNAVDEYKDRIKIGSIIYFKYSVDERSAVLRLKQNGVIKFING